MGSNTWVIDLSHHNTVTSFEDIRASGIIGVIHKATEGIEFSDPDYWMRRDEAEAAGLMWASYHFLRPGDVGLQMENFLNKVQPGPGERLVIDYEDEDCTLDELRDAIRILHGVVPECELTVYSGHLIKEQLGDDFDPVLAMTSLWIAQYTEAPEPDWPMATWEVWTLWQYGETGEVPGVEGPCDVNSFNGSMANCYAWFDPDYAEPLPGPSPYPEPEPLPVPVPAQATVYVSIDVPDGVAVRVTINGRPSG